MKMAFDEKDEAILRELRRNGKITLTELGFKLGLSPASIKNRIDKLEKLGAIRGYTAVVEPTFLNEFIQAIIEIEVIRDGSHVNTQLYAIGRLENVLGIYRKTGEFPIMIRANFKDMGELNRFVEYLMNTVLKANLKKYRVTVILDTIKENGVIFEKKKSPRRR